MSGQLHRKKCPVCHQGWFLPKSLLSHAQYCPGPSHWDNTSLGKSSRKRQHDEYFLPETLLQQRKRLGLAFKQCESSGIVRTADRLAAMPSIAHLASRVSQPTSGYVGRDDVEFANNHDVYEDGESDPIKLEMSNIRRHATLPPAVMYQIDMENTVRKHRGCDLNITDDIKNCTERHLKYNHLDLVSSKLYNRDELVTQLETVYNLKELKPQLHHVKLHDGSTATVPVFDVKATLLKMINNPEVMKEENMASNYDVFTGKPRGPSTKLDEIHTGNAWEPARQHYCGDDPDALPMGLVLFYDKTHTDLHGSLATAPLIAVPTFFNQSCRSNSAFHSVLGYIPNLSHGKGKSDDQSSRDKLQDEHNCLRLITEQLKQIQKDGGIWTEVMGRRVCVKVWIHIITGDTAGHNNVCGHYNASNSNCPYRDCICTLQQLSDALAQCYLTKLEDVQNLSASELQSWSKHDIDNAFDDTPLSDQIRGKLGVCPAEMLHVCGNGLYKYQLECVCELVGKRTSRQKQKQVFNTLHQHLVNDGARQSERDFPRMSVRTGVLDGTKMSATERLGNMMILMCLAHTTTGINLLRRGWSKNNIGHQEFRDCIKLQLAFEKWVNDPNEIHEVQSALPLVEEMIVAIQHCFPRKFGNAWCVPKMHSLAKMTYYMLKFGCAMNFTGQVGERVLKSVVKDVAQNTQRRPAVFAEQCAQRHYEEMVLEHAAADMRTQLDLNWERVANENAPKNQMRGRYTVTFHECDARGKGATSVEWSDSKKRKMGIRVSDRMRLAIRQFAFDNGYRGQFSITGYTSIKLQTNHAESARLFHASEYCHGEPWYDYGMVKYVDDDDMEHQSPAQILGFFRYDDICIPTPYLRKDKGYSLEEIQDNNMKDETMYAVVHSAKEPLFDWDDLQTEFVVPFNLGDVNNHLYIVDVKTITDAIFVFKDYGGKDSSKRFCVLPYRQWGKYFSDRIYADEESEEALL